ncbi:MAG: response regulator [Planctomycetes bacterium]|nr:response regulator [Planctomycetota bacterium]
MREPSILLIDDDQKHEVYLRMLNLENEGWTVRAAIDKTLKGTVSKAIKEIEANDGFTILIVDIKWPTDKRGGVKILNELSKTYKRSLPIRRGIIMSGASIPCDIELSKLAEVLKMKREWWTLQLTTPLERERLKKVLLEIWDKVKPQE